MHTSPMIKLADDDVIRLKYASHYFNSELQTFSVKNAYQFVRQQLGMTKEDALIYNWIREGVTARLLRSTHNSQGWIEGEISLLLVLQPEKSSSEVTRPQAFLPESGDVLEVPQPEARISGLSGICISQLTSQIRSSLGLTSPVSTRYYWLDPRGIECSVLRSGIGNSGWQSGLVRFQLEFLPKVAVSSPENSVIGHSELESLRQPINS
jgi:hypothetical protein